MANDGSEIGRAYQESVLTLELRPGMVYSIRIAKFGEVAERFKAAVLKTVEG